MNRETRKQLKQLNEKLTEIETDFELLKEKVDEIRSDVESIRDEEQDKYDNMPESIQQGEKGDTMQEGIDSLDDLYNELDSLYDELDNIDFSSVDSHEAFDL
jgi:chromosome segregation ATPase